jgi:steroid delta-isomerase-like uncharacterized protein
MAATPVPLTQVEQYFGAWNAHDPAAVAAAFADGGTYAGPTVTGPPLTGSGLAGHVAAMLAGFPDLRFEILNGPLAGGADGAVLTAQWLMHGTNTGPFFGQPPTGRPVALRGTDVITLADGKIGSVEGYFDRQALAEELGFQLRPLPPVAGPFQFGYAARTSSGSRNVPGAVSLTWVDARSEQEADDVKFTAAAIAAELSEQPGFISWVGLEIGRRLYTITLWDSADDIRLVMRNDTHLAAMKRLLNDDFCAAFSTGVWTAHHLDAVRVRCPACGCKIDLARASGACACGEPLPPAPEYW